MLDSRQPRVEIMKNQIAVAELRYIYHPPKKKPVLALDRISLEVKDQEFVVLLGPSGCGKSTLLYLIGGFLPFNEGQILIEGEPVRGPGPDRGIVFQHFALFPWKTVLGNVLYGMKRSDLPRKMQLERAQELIDMVGLSGFEESYPSQLSGGMKQRAAIARTLALNPKMLLMDEPFGALDAQTRSLMQEELRAICQRTRKTVIFVTHDVQEAVFLASRIIVMSARPGRIKMSIDVDLDSRDPEVHRSPRFKELTEDIWQMMRSEAAEAQRNARDS